MKTNQKGLLRIKFLLVLVLALLLVGAWYGYTKISKSSSSSSTSEPSKWAKYESKQYGFNFSYPEEWGEPKITESNNGSGKQYQLSFIKNPAPKYSIFAAIDTDFSLPAGCLEKCLDNKPYTKSDIESALSANKSSYIKYDKTSFTVLLSDPKNRLSQELFMSQIISIPKLNASAAQITYYVIGEKKCSTNKFADSEDSGCLTSATYSKIDKFAKSIQAS